MMKMILLQSRKRVGASGFEVTNFNDHVMALSNFNASSHNLILLAIRTPKLDVFELYEKLKRLMARPTSVSRMPLKCITRLSKKILIRRSGS